MWLWRTPENIGDAWDEILHNSISPLGPNPEVCAENFPYTRWRKTVVGLQQKISYSLPSPHTTTTMPSQQLSPAELRQQVEEMKRAQEKEEHEREEALLRAAEEEEKQEVERKQQEEEERKQQAEAALEAEQELREQGWQLDESLEEFRRCQRREEKWMEVDTEDQGLYLGCQSRKMECIWECIVFLSFFLIFANDLFREGRQVCKACTTAKRWCTTAGGGHHQGVSEEDRGHGGREQWQKEAEEEGGG